MFGSFESLERKVTKVWAIKNPEMLSLYYKLKDANSDDWRTLAGHMMTGERVGMSAKEIAADVLLRGGDYMLKQREVPKEQVKYVERHNRKKGKNH